MTTAADTCQAPSSPACDREAVGVVEHKGKSLRACAGHLKRHQRGGPLDAPLRARAAPGEPKMVQLAARAPEELLARVEATGADLSAAVREGLELWLAKRAAGQKRKPAGRR